VGRDRNALGGGRCGRDGIEDQQHLAAATIEYVPALDLDEDLEAQNFTIEALCRIEIGGIDHRLENAFGLHGPILSERPRQGPRPAARTVS